MPEYKIGIRLDADGNAAKEIGDTQGALSHLGDALPSVLGFGAAVGGALVAAGAAAFNMSSDIQQATNQIGAQMGLAQGQAKAYGEAIKTVYAGNWGDSIADVGQAIGKVAQQLHLAADNKDLPALTASAFALRDTFGVDVADSVSAAKSLMESFGLSGKEAFDYIAKGYEVGLDRSGDYLDTITEYSTQFANGGASAKEMFSILDTGLQGGALGTDKAADAFKEFRVRIQDGSKTTKDALESLGFNTDELTAKFADGSLTAIDAFNQVTSALRKTDDANLQMQAGVALLGTQFEDLGQSGALGLDSMSDNFADVSGSVDALNQKYADLPSFFQGIWRQALVGISPLGDAMLGLVNDNLPALQGRIGTITGVIQNDIGWLRLAWDANLGGMRDSAENFMTLDQDFKTFWDRMNILFGDSQQKQSEGWANWLTNVADFGTDWWRLTLENWGLSFVALHELWTAFTMLTSGEWEGFWDHMGSYANSAMDIFLNYVEWVFGPNIRNAIVNALTSMWNGMIEIWGKISEWWNGIWQSLDIIRQYLGLGGDANASPLQVPDLQHINPIVTPGAQAVGAAVGGQQIYQQFYIERGDAETVQSSAALGVAQAQRMRGS